MKEASQRKINTVYPHLLVESLKKKKSELTETGSLVEWGRAGQWIQAFSYKMNKLWIAQVQHVDNNI